MFGAAALTLHACGGGGSTQDPGAASRYAARLLVSDQPGVAAHIDAALSYPWSLAFNATVLWLTSPGSAHSAVFDPGNLALPPLVVGVPAQSAASERPTGVAFNPGNGFMVTSSTRSGVARFIVASDGGTLSGWAPSLAIDHAVIAFDGSSTGAVYTDLALTAQGDDSELLAADFPTARSSVSVPTSSSGPRLGALPTRPEGYAPFAIAALPGGRVLVAYAKPDATGRAPQAGAGLGALNAFDTAGRLLQRVVLAGGALNAPWSVVVAPADFGDLGGALLVANSGDGTIVAFDAPSGRFLGAIRKPDARVLVIDGLHGLAFGSGALGQPFDALFFSAGPQGGRHGLVGRIDLQ